MIKQNNLESDLVKTLKKLDERRFIERLLSRHDDLYNELRWEYIKCEICNKFEHRNKIIEKAIKPYGYSNLSTDGFQTFICDECSEKEDKEISPVSNGL